MRNQINRLHTNIKNLIQMKILDDEFFAFAQNMPNCNNIEELNEAIENEIFYIQQEIAEEQN